MISTSTIRSIIKGLILTGLISLQVYLEKLVNTFRFDYPFGKKPRSSHNRYLELAMETQLQSHPEVEKYEQQTGYLIDHNWLHELALHTQVVIKESPLCYAHGRVLYSSLSQYLSTHLPHSSEERITIWETGTARGFSALCMARALADQNRAGTIISFDILPHDIKMYWNCIDDHEGPKSREKLLLPWKELIDNSIIFHQGDTRLELPKVKAGRINFAFLDGAHTYKDVLFEFSHIREHQMPGDIIVYDDYTPAQFPGIVQAVDEICMKYNYNRTDLKTPSGRGYVIAIKN